MIELPYLIIIIIILHANFCSAMYENERVNEYHKRKYKWPIEAFVPETEGWRKLMQRRLKQIQFIEDGMGRYNAWVQVIGSALVTPNFTHYGWGLARAPQHLVDLLKENLYNGLNSTDNQTLEGKVEVINDGGNHAYFFRQDQLNQKVLHELLPMHERWSGIELVPSVAYGLRAYRNSSVLRMHSDKSSTHVISCILHVDHSEDSEPWPIIIEDLLGETNEVYLESGDMLFYESSKCLHGRPRPFVGSWYSSIFVHYRPYDWNKDKDLESHYAVPPMWNDVLSEKERDVEELEIVGTGFLEPSCYDNWCALSKETKKWYGPAPFDGPVIDPGTLLEKNDDKTCSL